MNYTDTQLKSMVRTIARQLMDADIKDSIKLLNKSIMDISLGELIDVITPKLHLK